MTTAEFIEKTYNTKNERWGKHGYDRWCSSVKTDKNGIVYSYGSHYPLAFKVKGLDFINVAPYSSSTGRHQLWARQAIGYDSLQVKLWRDEAQVIANEYASEDKKLKAIQTALIRELTDITVEMKGKKRKDTNVYRRLSTQQTALIDALARTKVVA